MFGFFKSFDVEEYDKRPKLPNNINRPVTVSIQDKMAKQFIIKFCIYFIIYCLLSAFCPPLAFIFLMWYIYADYRIKQELNQHLAMNPKDYRIKQKEINQHLAKHPN
jgi:hypothetical protein